MDSTRALQLAALCYFHGLTSSLLTRGTQPVISRVLLGPCGHGSLSAESTIRCKLVLTQDSYWLKLSRGRMHISLHNAHDFWSTTWVLPLIYTGEFCSEKSLIDYQWSLCNRVFVVTSPPLPILPGIIYG